MVFWTFIGEHLIDLLFTLVSAGLLFLCKKIWSDKETYKRIVENNNNQIIADTVSAELKSSLDPIVQDIAQIRREMSDLNKEVNTLKEDIKKLAKKEQTDVDIFLDSEKTRLIELCQEYLAKGFMTTDESQKLITLYNNYQKLGGNGEAEKNYKLASRLPVHN